MQIKIDTFGFINLIFQYERTLREQSSLSNIFAGFCK